MYRYPATIISTVDSGERNLTQMGGNAQSLLTSVAVVAPVKTTDEQRRGRGSGGITGKGWQPGVSGNPGGRPKGLARFIRDQTMDGEELATFMLEIFRGETSEADLRDRIAAATWLADRGFGKPVQAMQHAVEMPQSPGAATAAEGWQLDAQDEAELERLVERAALRGAFIGGKIGG